MIFHREAINNECRGLQFGLRRKFPQDKRRPVIYRMQTVAALLGFSLLSDCGSRLVLAARRAKTDCQQLVYFAPPVFIADSLDLVPSGGPSLHHPPASFAQHISHTGVPIMTCQSPSAVPLKSLNTQTIRLVCIDTSTFCTSTRSGPRWSGGWEISAAALSQLVTPPAAAAAP